MSWKGDIYRRNEFFQEKERKEAMEEKDEWRVDKVDGLHEGSVNKRM